MDSKTTIQELKNRVKKFCEERDWDQFHGAKDISVSMIIEAAELLEHFRFKSEKEIDEMLKNPEKKEHIQDEVSDVLYWVLRLAQKYNFDLSDSFLKKIEKSGKKYPVEKAKGSNKKYTEF